MENRSTVGNVDEHRLEKNFDGDLHPLKPAALNRSSQEPIRLAAIRG